MSFFSRLLGLETDDSPQERLDKLVNQLRAISFDDPEHIAILASLLSIPPDDRCAPLEYSPIRLKERTLEVLMDWLREYSSSHPVLFVVEDLHWVDPTTLEFIAMHIDQGMHDSVLSLLSFRPDFRTPWASYSHMTQVALTRLTKRQIGEMIKWKTGVESVPAEIVAKVSDRTDGVPLFVEEFGQLVEESGILEAEQKGEDIAEALNAIPVTLQDLLVARLDRLESIHGVVQLGATIGREFSFEMLQATAKIDEHELQFELTKLVDAELLFQKGKPPNSRYIFKHALIQDAAYNSLLKEKRQQFHKLIAEALEESEQKETQPELLANHFSAAAESQKAIPYWLQAGQHAQQRSANAEAIGHLTRGLKELGNWDESPERDQLELGFQLTLVPILMAAKGWSSPEVGTAIERARQLVEKIGSIADQFFVMWGQWGWRVIRADMDICDKISDEVMQLVAQSDDPDELLMEAHWIPGCTGYYRGEFRNALEHMEKGLALYVDKRGRENSLKTGQNCGVMYRNHIALALWEIGRVDEALTRADEMLSIAKELNHPFTLAMALHFRRRLLQCCGRDEEARKVVEEEYKLCHDQGFVFFEVHVVFSRGEFLVQEGKFDEAREQFDTGLTMMEATGGRLSMDHPFGRIANAYIDAGKLDDANRWLLLGEELVNKHNYRSMESEFLRLRGEQSLAAEKNTDAEKFFDEAIEVAIRQESKSRELRAKISLAKMRVAQEKKGEAKELIEDLYQSFSEGFNTADLQHAKSLLDNLN